MSQGGVRNERGISNTSPYESRVYKSQYESRDYESLYESESRVYKSESRKS